MAILRKISSITGLFALSLILGLASCQTTTIGDKPEEPGDKPDKPGNSGTDTPGGWKPPTTNGGSDVTPPEPTDPPEPPEPPKDPEPPVVEEAPFGIPVPGQKGMIKSPHAPTSGLIDVSGMKPGTKIRCPYSGNVIRVP